MGVIQTLAMINAMRGGSGGGGGGSGDEPYDGDATRIHVSLIGRDEKKKSLNITQSVSDGVVFDWGDGSAPETVSGTGLKTVSHTYGQPGDYIISLLPEDGCELTLGSGSGSVYFFGESSYSIDFYRSMAGVKRIDIGNKGVTRLLNKGLYGLREVEQLNLSNNVARLEQYAISSSNNISSLVLPESVNYVGNNALYMNRSLKQVDVLGDVSLGYQVFSETPTLRSVIFHRNVIEIDNGIFTNCYNLGLVDFSHCTAVPTLKGGQLYVNAASTIEIRVPAALVDEWKAATNWSTYADYIVGV